MSNNNTKTMNNITKYEDELYSINPLIDGIDESSSDESSSSSSEKPILKSKKACLYFEMRYGSCIGLCGSNSPNFGYTEIHFNDGSSYTKIFERKGNCFDIDEIFEELCESVKGIKDVHIFKGAKIIWYGNKIHQLFKNGKSIFINGHFANKLIDTNANLDDLWDFVNKD